MILPVEIALIDDQDGLFQKQLLRLLIAENIRKTGDVRVDRSIIRIQDTENETSSGGIWTEILDDWMYIEILYVPETLRGRGFGSILLKRAEEIAVSKGCVGIWLETFDFQAPGFYLTHGYSVFATLDNYPVGSNRRFLHKVFASCPNV